MDMCYIYYRCKVIDIGASSIVGCIVMGGIKVMLRGKSVVCSLKLASKVCISPDEGWSKHSVGLDGKALSNEASQSICITLATLRICMSLAIPDKCIVLAIRSIAMAIHSNVLVLMHNVANDLQLQTFYNISHLQVYLLMQTNVHNVSQKIYHFAAFLK